MWRHLTRAALALLLGFIATGAVQAQIAISPQTMDLTAAEGGKTHAFRLYNLTGHTKHVRVSLASWDMTEENKVHDLPPSETSLDRWTIVNPLEFTLEPSKSQAVRLSIQPAVELAPGEHRVMIYFDEVPGPDTEESTLKVRFRIGAAVYLHVGPVTRGGTLNRSEADAAGYRLNVTTTGNATSRFDGQFVVYEAAHFPGDGKVPHIEKLGTPDMKMPPGAIRAGAIQSTAVLPGDTRTVSGDYSGAVLPPGRYSIQFSGKFGETPVDRRVDVQVAAATKH
jgi:P pilus assembly chaperone PapD